jgi:hypothetical protein
MMADRQQRRRELEAAMTKLVDGVGVHFDEKNLSLLRDFIDNREFGVALEWLHSLVASRHIELTPSQSQEVGRLADDMGIDLSQVR